MQQAITGKLLQPTEHRSGWEGERTVKSKPQKKSTAELAVEPTATEKRKEAETRAT